MNGLLWFSVLAGPAAWALRELASYALVAPVCTSGNRYLLIGTAGLMLLLALSGAWVGRRCFTRVTSGRDGSGAVADRSTFMAIVGTGLSLLVALLIVLSLVPELVLSPCE